MLLGLVVLAGCATKGGPVPYNVQNFDRPDIASPLQAAADYHVGPADVLGVAVFGVPEFTGDYPVDNLGRIQLPLVGLVVVQGQTSDQVASTIKTRLQSTYLRDPQVQVIVKAMLSQRITVEGSVAQPGIYPLSSNTSLLQAVAMARGETADSNPHRVVVFRTIGGKRVAAAFDLLDIRQGKQADIQVYGDDIVVVDGDRVGAQLKSVLTAAPIFSIIRPF